MFSGKPVASSINVLTFTASQYHKVQLKCFKLNFATVPRKTSRFFVLNRHVHVTAVLTMSKNYYDILGVSRNANQKQIKEAYYKLAMEYHPDKNQGKLTQKFRDIKEAYDVLSNESSRMKYNNSSSFNNTGTSDNWSSSSFYDRYKSPPYEEYRRTNSKTERQRSYNRHSYNNYSHLKPFNVFINVIKVPNNIIKTQLDILLLTFIKNRILKMILLTLFQYLWKQVLKNLNCNVLLSSTQTSSLVEFVKNLLLSHTIRIELTELEAVRGKAIRVQVDKNEKVLVVNLPGGVKKDQSFYLFYLIDDNSNSTKFN
ncbi:Hypothetical protein CINCED_3A018674 [Cinara cedri]|nr:Hypothetical protein CINCED_3A018674 [Cinara cedri]